jgi:hypothetical protein
MQSSHVVDTRQPFGSLPHTGNDIDDIMGEFMRDRDVTALRAIIKGEPNHVEVLRRELSQKRATGHLPRRASMAAQYRRGVQLCMRYAYWRSIKVPENDVFMDASGCLWTTTEQNHEEHQADMLVMRTTQDIPFEDVHNTSDDGRWFRAIGFLDALAHLEAVEN